MYFRRVMRLLTTLLGVFVGVTAVVVAILSRRVISPVRQRLWARPSDVGLDYEDVEFPARDGVRLSGWFIPGSSSAEKSGATIILLHAWTWNRLGDSASDLSANLTGTTPVEFLRLAHGLHYEGYNVLMLDLRNHGESASQPPVTFGQQEADDLLGALSYLSGREDVDPEGIGAVGFAMGANAILYALPQTSLLRAAVAVQPATTSEYAHRYARDVLGPYGEVVLPLTEMAYAAVGGVGFSGLQPAFAAGGAGETPVLFVQTKHDPWGSVEDVDRLTAATPHGEGPLYVDGTHHYHGYQYVINNPKIVTAFFEQYF